MQHAFVGARPHISFMIRLYTVDCTLPKTIWTRAQIILPYWTRL